jgi:hypothetical protein
MLVDKRDDKPSQWLAGLPQRRAVRWQRACRTVRCVLLLLLLIVSRGQAQLNGFGKDAILVLKVGRQSPPCSAGPCLQPVFVQALEGPFARAGLSIPVLTAASGSQQPCTLPPDAVGVGQLSLSGDGLTATFACFAHPPGTLLSAGTKRTVAVIDYSGNVDTSTVFVGNGAGLGDFPLSVVTDNGTTAWIAGPAGVGVVQLGTSSLSSPPPLLYSASAARHVTIANDPDGTTGLVVTAKDEVLLLSSSASATDLPRSALELRPPRRLFAAKDAYGHAIPVLPRGGKLYQNDSLDLVNSDLQKPLVALGALASSSMASSPFGRLPLVYSAHPVNTTVDPSIMEDDGSGFQNMTVGYHLYLHQINDTSLFNGNITPWRRQHHYTVESGLDVLYLASQSSRYVNHAWQFNYDDKITQVRALAILMATSSRSVYNFTVVNSRYLRSDTQPLVNYWDLPRRDRPYYRLLGICYAPLNVNSAFIAPTSFPTSTPSRSASPTMSQSPGSAPIYSASPTSTMGYLEQQNYGVHVSAPFDGFQFPGRYLLLLRIGNITTGPGAYDFRNASGVNPWLAQPLFIDKYDKIIKRVVQTIPLPTKAQGAHKACTNSIVATGSGTPS